MIRRNNSRPEDYHKQTNNKRSPFVTCFPTSMINAGETVRVQFPKPVMGSAEAQYEQEEDRYDLFLHSEEIRDMFANDPNIQQWLRGGTDLREIYAVEVAAFNKWVGYNACEFINKLSLRDVKWILDQGGAIVTSGVFCGLGHCITIVGYLAEDNEELTHITIDDPYGNPLKNYKPVGTGGNDVDYPLNDFWKATDKGNGNHFGVVFLPKGQKFVRQ